MPGVTPLEKTLIGVEATAGATTDAPTTYWRGIGKIKDRREVVFPPERIGKIGGTTRSYIPRTGGEVMLEQDATFEQMNYIRNAGIYFTTPTTDTGTGTGIIRTWTVQHSSSDALATTDLATLVVESGDNNDMEVARYAFVREYTVTGKQGEGLHVSATLESRAPSTSAGFTAVTDTDFENAAEVILMSMGSLHIDDTTGTIGTTTVTETILEFSLKHTTGWVALPARDGRLDFSSIKHVDDEIILDVTFEHNATAVTEKAAWRAQTERAIRLQFAGTALTSAGAYTTKIERYDLYGKWMTFGAEGLEDQSGDNIYRGTFKVAYSPSAAKKCVFLNVTEQSTLP